MGVRGLLRSAGITQDERRRSPRIRCRLSCSVRRGRRELRARVLDVSEGGLCILSPVSFAVKQPLLIQIDVPQHGPVEVEAVAWHVRRVRGGSPARAAWSIGLMIVKAGAGFEVLLPDSGETVAGEASQKLASTLEAMSRRHGAPRVPAPEESALEEDMLSAAELDALDLDLLSPAELRDLAQAAASAPDEGGTHGPDDTLQLFRVRVQQRGGPRTRTLTFGAVSESEATELATAELGDAWRILEVRPA